MNDKEFKSIVPSFVEMQSKYNGLIKDFADELEPLEDMKDSLEMHNRPSVFQLAVGNATILKRKLFSDIDDLCTIYRSKLNKGKLMTPLVVTLPAVDFTNLQIASVQVALPKQGGFNSETWDTPSYCVVYDLADPRVEPGGLVAGTLHRPELVNPTPAQLYEEAAVMLKLINPIIKEIAKHYHNQPPLIRFEKHLIAASQIINAGLVSPLPPRTPGPLERFGKIRGILKEKFYPNL